MHRHLDELEETRKSTERVWKILERHLSDRAYIAGSRFTMADIAVGIMAHWWYRMPIDHFDLPDIEAWHRRLCERPAYQHQVLQ